MDLKGFVDKASTAANAAKDAALRAAEQARADFAPAARPNGEPGESALQQITQAGADKVQELVTAFQNALPAIALAGYELTEFEIELGLTPKLIPHFRCEGRSPEDIERARETLKQNKVGSLVLSALLKAGDVQRQINVAGFAFSHIEIELGLIPSVRLQYKNEGAEAPRVAATPLLTAG